MMSPSLPAAFSTSVTHSSHALINVRTVPLIQPSQLNRKRPRHNHINSCTNRKHILNTLFATDPDIHDESGSYIDLGTITSNNIHLDDSSLENVLQSSQLAATNNHTSQQQSQAVEQQWRSNHWIVLIDDEPSIRLAIGDYLHSMGYTVITACDGPQSFLDVLLYSCGWSFLEDDGDDSKPPPWMVGDETMLWRLPNCIISDIRMPGGVDGVELLQLLRSSNDVGVDMEQENDVKKKKKKKKGRPKRQGQEERSNTEYYDTKDEFELLDVIVSGGGATNVVPSDAGNKQSSSGKILTAIDQAKQKLTVIRDTLTHHQDMSSNSNNTSQRQQQQYPTSLLQIPVILLTAKAMVSDRIVGFKAGANNYLPKPFRPEELLGMVDSLLKKQERERKEWLMSVEEGSGGSGNAVVKGSSESQFDIESYSASAQQLNDLRMELIEIKNLLKEQEQREMDVKMQNEEMGRLSNLLPNALWMYMNGERRKRLFSVDHIRSILMFCFRDKSLLAKRRNVKRNDLLDELDRMNDEYPDALHDFLHD